MNKFLKQHFFLFGNIVETWGFGLVKRDGWYLDIHLGFKFIAIWFGRGEK